MFNAEKILGGLLKQGLGESLTGGAPGTGETSGGALGGKAAVGMGVLGVAFAAVEHYLGRHQDATPPPSPLPVQGSPAARCPSPPAPPSPAGAPIAVQTSTPEFAPSTPPTPPPMPAAQTPDQKTQAAQDELAIACIRAMIAAAWADGSMDGDERATILKGFETLDLSPAETAFLHQELAMPQGIPAIIEPVSTPDQAQAVYAAACMAIIADTPAEHAFLDALAAALHIAPHTARELKRV